MSRNTPPIHHMFYTHPLPSSANLPTAPHTFHLPHTTPPAPSLPLSPNSPMLSPAQWLKMSLALSTTSEGNIFRWLMNSGCTHAASSCRTKVNGFWPIAWQSPMLQYTTFVKGYFLEPWGQTHPSFIHNIIKSMYLVACWLHAPWVKLDPLFYS